MDVIHLPAYLIEEKERDNEKMTSLQILLGGGGVGNCRLSPLLAPAPPRNSALAMNLKKGITRNIALRGFRRRSSAAVTIQRRFSQISASLDLTEDNVKLVLQDARTEFAHIFDTSMGMTGVAELAEVDGPFVKISLRGRFWHERSLILARIGNYLKQRIPEILEVDIEDEQQLDDSPENF